MSKFDKEKVMWRYMLIVAVLIILCLAVIGKAAYLMKNKKEYWSEVAGRLKSDSLTIPPKRGNILSADGRLMATSLPEYAIYMDFMVGTEKQDSIWKSKLDTIAQGLHNIFPSWTADKFRKHLEEGRKKQRRHWRIWPKRIDYVTFMNVRQLPIFNTSKYVGGFHWETFNARRRPFGSLAQRTIGELYGMKDSARFGLELAYDSVLRGKNGIVHRRKILNRYMSIPVQDPVDGADIITTIDPEMQDLAERTLVNELIEVNARVGVAILMEVETGDIKAMVNMTRCSDGRYRETMNLAINHRCEPGSVFKTASILVALDDGVVDTSYIIHTGNGRMPIHGREMRDHNWRRGGYGDINIARALEVSSNVGVSHVIETFYHNNPEKYVQGLYRVGIHDSLSIPLAGYSPPVIRMPKKNKRGQYTNWSKTSLPWMSIGYETMIPPINTVTFYNAIANGGKMLQPRFVKAIVKTNDTLTTFPPVVLREAIAKPQTIKTMQTILTHVVSQGLGRKASSRMFSVAGKTGTAQVSKGKAGYASNGVDYWLSFAGFFPGDKPKYTCLVCIEKHGLPASGGEMCGKVFHEISEGVMSRQIYLTYPAK